jgi:superfamily I DNA and RNA helicase
MNETDTDLRVRIDELIDKVTLQESLYSEMSDLSRTQLAELDSEDDGQLAVLSGKKSSLLARIENLDSETSRQYEQCKPLLDQMSREQQFRLQVARLRASEALREAVATEEEGRKRARERLDHIQDEIAAVNRSQQVASKYKPKLRGEGEPKFLDEKG